jgi:hypothetical protein
LEAAAHDPSDSREGTKRTKNGKMNKKRERKKTRRKKIPRSKKEEDE